MSDLQTALDAELHETGGMTVTVSRLIERYRSDRPATAPILSGPVDAAAYAAYRMPATYAAVRAALGQVSPRLARQPQSLLDIGGGSGAAAWAACRVLPGITDITVTDGVRDVLALGRRIAVHAVHPALRTAQWTPAQLSRATRLDDTDLIVVSYVLGELDQQTRGHLIDEVAEHAGTAVLVEPGTPAGYRRILTARATLIEAGRTIAAPCPHQHTCPLTTDDWCHFAARLNRSSTHRRIKNANLGYEDEKFAFVAATRHPTSAVTGRILRHPVTRKGMVEFRVCQDDGRVKRTVVSQRQPSYREARAAGWGDPWPPTAEPSAFPDSQAPSTLD